MNKTEYKLLYLLSCMTSFIQDNSVKSDINVAWKKGNLLNPRRKRDGASFVHLFLGAVYPKYGR